MSFAYLPLYTGDYIRDTQHLSCSEHGIFLKLLMHCWDQKGPAPLDERKLCGIVNARSSDEIEAMRRILGEFFIRMEDGHYNQRMQKEIERSEAISGARSEAGRKGAVAKAKHLPSKSQASAKQVPLSPSPSLSLDKEVSEANASSSAEPTQPGIPNCQHDSLIALYHEVLPELPRVRLKTADRQKALSKVWRWVLTSKKADGTRRATDADGALEWFRLYFLQARDNDFLMGRQARSENHKGWECTLDYLLTDKGMKMVIERTYSQEAA